MAGHQPAAVDRHQMRQVLVHAEQCRHSLKFSQKIFQLQFITLVKTCPLTRSSSGQSDSVGGAGIEGLDWRALTFSSRLTKTKPRHSVSATE